MTSRHWLPKWLTRDSRRSATPSHRKPRPRLCLEALEDRVVPSAMVLFSTGSETVNESAGKFSIPVTLTGAPTLLTSTFASGFSAPGNIAFAPNGNFYVPNYNAGTVSEVTPNGAVSTFASGFSHPDAVAFDAAGNLYVVNFTTFTGTTAT